MAKLAELEVRRIDERNCEKWSALGAEKSSCIRAGVMQFLDGCKRESGFFHPFQHGKMGHGGTNGIRKTGISVDWEMVFTNRSGHENASPGPFVLARWSRSRLSGPTVNTRMSRPTAVGMWFWKWRNSLFWPLPFFFLEMALTLILPFAVSVLNCTVDPFLGRCSILLLRQKLLVGADLAQEDTAIVSAVSWLWQKWRWLRVLYSFCLSRQLK